MKMRGLRKYDATEFVEKLLGLLGPHENYHLRDVRSWVVSELKLWGIGFSRTDLDLLCRDYMENAGDK